MDALVEAFAQVVALALKLGFAPWARLFDRGRPASRPGLSWTTRVAAGVVLIEVVPMLLFLFFLARFFARLSSGDLMLVIGLVIFLPVAAITAAIAIGLAGAAALATTELLQGNPTARWMTVGWSTAGVVIGAALSLLHPPTLGYLLGGFCALEVVLLVLPVTAADFGVRHTA